MRILATSREPLGITGEALWQVAPLEVPDSDAGPDQIGSTPAVQLLRNRAATQRKDLPDDAAALSTMARICRALDGMPLAIELAAARVRTMSLDQLANRLDDRFRLLTSGSRTVLPRHQTLRAVVDWSWELLTDPERMVLRRLSVFIGGAGLEAAEQICAGAGEARGQVLELLSSLTEKSLLVAEGDDAPRYRMLGTIKEYAAQRLSEAGEVEQIRRSHLAYFTELTETAEPHLRRAEQVEWIAVLDIEHDNITAAMRGAIAAGDAQAAMRLAAGAGWYWWLSGHRAEGMELITAATDLPGEVPDQTRALVYAFVVQFLSSGRGDERWAEDWIHQAYRLTRGLTAGRVHPALKFVAPLEALLQGPEFFLSAWEPLLEDEDPWVRALARLQLGKMRILIGHGGRDADAFLETALAEFQALGERFGTWFATTELADRNAVRGEFERACEQYEQAIAVYREVGAVEDIIRMRARQAQLHWLLGDEESSAAATAAAHRCAERVTWPDALAELALSQAELARWRGDTDEAIRQLAVATAALGQDMEQPNIRVMTHDLLGYLSEDLDDARRHRSAAYQAAIQNGLAATIAPVLVGIADLALRTNQYEQAVQLLMASAAVRGLPDRSHPDVARIEQVARVKLGDERYAVTADSPLDWPRLVERILAD
jgi:predicted ATPase